MDTDVQPPQMKSICPLYQPDELTFGPFTPPLSQIWLDCWMEIVTCLSSKNLYQLSCVSKSLNSLVWSQLIPACEKGMYFPKDIPTQVIEGYLARVPSLKHLGLRNLHKSEIFSLSLLSHITQLQSISLPSIDGEYFPFRELSHLTSLTKIDLGEMAFSEGSFGHFQKLKSLQIHCSSAEDFSAIQQLTQLEDLALFAPDFVGKPCFLLTQLKSLTLWCEMKDLDLPLLPNLTELACPWETQTLPQVSQMTKLLDLHMVFEPDLILEVGKSLVNLTKLSLSEIWPREGQQVPPEAFSNFKFLTNLLQLKVFGNLPCQVLMDQLEELPNLTSLEIIDYNNLKASPESIGLGRLIQLKKLSLSHRSNNHWFLTGLQNLTKLDLFPSGIQRGETGHYDLGFLVPLTKLTSFSFGKDGHAMEIQITEELSVLTRLTSLKIRECRRIDDLLQHLDVLSGLKKLALLGSDIGNSGLQAISKKLTNLEYLNLAKPLKPRAPILPHKETNLDILFELPRLQELVLQLRTGNMVRDFWKRKIESYRKENR